MIYGQFNQPFQIHIDKVISEEESKWVYGAFNFIIDGRFYPGEEINWTLNVIVDWLKSFLNEKIDDFDMYDCENKEATTLLKEAVISRLGYYYDEPDKIIPIDKFKIKYPQKIGIEIPLFELSGMDFEMFFFRGKEKDFLIFYFQDEINKVELKKGYFHSVIASLPDFYGIKPDRNV